MGSSRIVPANISRLLVNALLNALATGEFNTAQRNSRL